MHLAAAVLADAAVAFGDVPGIEVVDEGDLVRSFAPGRPEPYLNCVARLRVASGDLGERVAAVERTYRPAGLPTSWWVDDWTVPADAADLLRGLGLRPAGSEAVMVLDLAGDPVAVADARERAMAAGVSVRRVQTIDDLEAWMEVMATAYGWPEAGRAERVGVMRDVYDPRTRHGRDPRRTHVLAELGGVAVGAASLFAAAGQGWVTNVGTIPSARGRGVGAAVTIATLDLATERGHPTAWLAASEMGEPVYARLGFRSVGRLGHLVGPAATG